MKNRAFFIFLIVFIALLTPIFNVKAYSYKREINCANLDDGTPIVINGSDGFEIDGEKQIVWTYCSGNGTALYYNNYSDYAVANDTTQLPMEVESGNGTSYNPENVWDDDYVAVYHFGELSGTTFYDSTSNSYDGDIKGSVSLGNDCRIGKCFGYHSSNSDYLETTSNFPITGSTNRHVETWYSSNKTSDPNVILNWGSYSQADQNALYIAPNWAIADIYYNGFDIGGLPSSVSSGNDLANGTWYNFVGGLDGTTDGDSYIYWDGEDSGITDSDTNSITTSSTKLTIGYMPGWSGSDRAMSGLIDEVRISDITRSLDYSNQTYQNIIGTSGYGDLGAEESSEGITITSHTTSPSIVYTNKDFKFNMTATSPNNATFTGYVQFYVNGTSSGAAQSTSMNNNTNTLIGTLSSSSFGTGAELIAEYWVDDGENTTTKVNQSTVTVQPPSFSISLGSPSDDYQTNNNTPAFTYTVSGSSENYDCSLYLNGSSYGTNSTTMDSTPTTIVASTISDGIYSWNITCTSYETTNESEARTIRIDTEDPVINDNFINNSVYLQDNITGQFNFTDNILLHSLNISIDDSAIYTNESIDATSFQYDLFIDTSTLSNDQHELFIRIADGHTAEELKSADSYNPKVGLFDNYLKYEIREPYIKTDITMKLKDQSVYDYWEAIKYKDRYSEIVRPANRLSTQTFVVESDRYIHIANDPKGNYKGQWLIIGDHWKDFVLKNEPESRVSIKRITDNKVEVIISGIKNTGELVFESTGDLNIVTKTYYFYVSNSTLEVENYPFETDPQTMTFILNKTAGMTTNAELWLNGTYTSSSKDSYDTYDVYTSTFRTPFVGSKEENLTGYWDYNITDESTESNNVSFNQTVYRMSIDDCSEYTTRAINFTMYDESTSDLLPVDGEIHATMHLSRSNSSDYRSTSLDYSLDNEYGLCIYPSWANYTIDFSYFEYLAEDYAVKEYSTAPFEINNVTQNIDLYLTQTSLSDNVIISLKDSDGNALEGYNIRSKRYYPETGEEVTVEISRTDYKGQAIAHLILYSVYYSFSIETTDGEVLDIITPSKIYADTLTFILDLDDGELNFEDKVWYSITPDSPVQPNVTNFTLTTSSPGDYIEWFAIGADYNGTDYLDNSTSPGGGSVTISLDLTNQTGWISIDYYIKAEDETLLTFQRGYYVTDVVAGDYSIEGQKEGWESIFNVMWRVVAAVFVSVVFVLMIVPYIGPESAGVVGVLVQIAFVIMGWIPVWIIIVEAVILLGLYLLSNRGSV